jgi:serine/threonine-protein kinase
MAIQIGQQLGSLEITALLGKGGMGEVYRARDTKLKRDVAIKILPDEFARDADRVNRFQREAEVLASLSHPNIAGIHDLQHIGETQFLVMELVEGETLADRLKRVPLPVEDALRIGKSICEALEAAHEKAIVHRDLKPANVKITPDGKVKVLDFGLAKAIESTAAHATSHSPTIIDTMGATNPGLILGTAAYMSPEQAKGRQADAVSDIFSFGCVLYEMLTAKQPFEGETVTEILAGVLKAEPDWNALPDATPLPIRILLRRCLQKDQSRRFHSATDVRIEIEEAGEARAVHYAFAPPAGRPLWVRALVIATVAIAGAGIGIAAWSIRHAPALDSRPTSRFTVPLPPGQQLPTLYNPPVVALSADGSRLVYASGLGQADRQLYLREMDTQEGKPISGTGGALGPFFSPDGQWVGFFDSGKMKKISVAGGASLTLCDAPDPRGAVWTPDSTIFFAPSGTSGISKVSASGGTPEIVTVPDPKKGESSHRWPELLPGGETLLYAVQSGIGPEGSQIVARSLKSGQQKLLIQGGTYPRYSPSGHLIYFRAPTLMAVPFDPVRLEIKGSPAPVVEGVLPTPGASAGAEMSFSQNGSMLYVPGGPGQAASTLVWVDRKGNVQQVGAPDRAYTQPQLSPDGKRLAIRVLGANGDIWVYDFQRGTLTRLTFDGAARPVWTPDGKRISFSADRGKGLNWFWKLADGTGQEEQLTRSQHFNINVSFTSDGKTGFYTENDAKNGLDIWSIQLDGDRKATPFLQTPFNETVAVISPDDRWLAYVSNESGRNDVYIRAYPGPGGKWQISTDGGDAPVWSRNGKELFYWNGDNMMAVDIAGDTALRAGTPRLLFEGKYEKAGIGRNYDVTPDGQRFLMIKSGTANGQTAQMNVVMNWFEELKRRVPVH